MKYRSIQQMFSDVAAEFGASIAIEHGGRVLTYSELESESNRLANFLLDGGLARGGMVGLFTDNPATVITGILGVLKAGGVFVPLDPTFPERRLETLSEQVRPEWYVSEHKHLEKLSRLTSVHVKVVGVDGHDYSRYDIKSHPALENDP